MPTVNEGEMPRGQEPGDRGQESGGRVPGSGDGGQAPAGEMSLEQAMAELTKARQALKEVNSESAGRRKRLDDLEMAEKQRQDAALSEAERISKRTQELQGKVADLEKAAEVAQREHQERVIRYEVMLKASGMGFVDLDAVTKLMDWTALEFDDDGTPKNVEGVLKKLQKDKPYLLKTEGRSGLGTPAGKAPAAPRPGTNGQIERRKVTPL